MCIPQKQCLGHLGKAGPIIPRRLLILAWLLNIIEVSRRGFQI